MIITLIRIVIIIDCGRQYKESDAKGLLDFADKQEYFAFAQADQRVGGRRAETKAPA